MIMPMAPPQKQPFLKDLFFKLTVEAELSASGALFSQPGALLKEAGELYG